MYRRIKRDFTQQMKCDKCKKKFKDKDIHRHHIFPQHLGGTDTDGTIYICKKCHNQIHEYLNNLGYVNKEVITKFTNDWLEGKRILKVNEKFPFCPKCKDTEKRLSIREVWRDCLILGCIYCGYQEKSSLQLYNDFINKQVKEISEGNKKLFLKTIKEKEDDSISEF